MKALIIIIFVILWGAIWLYGSIWEELTEDERLDRLYKKLEEKFKKEEEQ